jgi:hypothetical protein
VDRSPLSVLDESLSVVLPDTAGMEPISPALLFEPAKLHVTSLEYNSVYSQPSTAGGAIVTSSPTIVPAAVSSAAPGTAPPATSAPSAAPSQTSYVTNSCAAGQCAAVVIALDQPIDPNLVVTVNGTVLTRVRDWRGRATSILPAAESGSDLVAAPAPASSPAALNQPQTLFRTSPGILESDQLGPNSWYALDSHRVLLTISSQIASAEEFPMIRLSDPSKKVLTLPLDLDQGFSEVITDGFHLAARTPEQLRDRILNRYLGSAPTVGAQPYDLHPAGPYPAGTFLPLFLRNPDQQNLYAYLGETGRQILIGFRSDSLSAPAEKRSYNWLPARDQVILEDRNLDLAWSLDCAPQASQLVCDIPQQQIAIAYQTVHDNCPDAISCSAHGSIADLPFVSSLELWVEQYDPNGTNMFYSGSPIPLGLFPIEENTTSITTPPIGFVSWRFQLADAQTVTLLGCGYSDYFSQADLHKPDGTGVTVNRLRILGRDPMDTDTYRSIASTDECPSFSVPTDSITTGDVVVIPAYMEGTTLSSALTSSKTPMAISSTSLRPFFGRPTVTPTWKSGTPTAKQTASVPADCWTIDFSAGRLDPGDRFTRSASVPEMLNISWPGQSGQPEEISPCPPSDAAPKTMIADAQASRSGRIHLRMVVNRGDLPLLPKDISLFRGNFAIARLNIPQILLPSKVKLEPIGPIQFALTGTNANLIDAVTLQDGKNTYTIPTAIGTDFALVNLPEKAPSTANSKGGGKSPTISSVALDAAGKNVVISGQGFGDEIGTVTFNGNSAHEITVWNTSSITAQLPSGEMLGQTIKVEVTTSKLTSGPFEFTTSKPTTATCSAVTGPCITKAQLDPTGKSLVLSGQAFGDKKGTYSFNGAKPTAAGVGSWTDSSVRVALPADKKAVKSLRIQLTTAQVSSDPFNFTIGATAPSTKTNSTSTPSPTPAETSSTGAQAATDQPTTSVNPSTYAVIPLFRVTGSGPSSVYMPLEVSGSDGKPLIFTVPKAAAKPSTTTPPASTTTITVTKSPPGSTTPGTTPAAATPQPAQNQ